MTAEEKRKRGRPAGSTRPGFVGSRSIRLTQMTMDAMAALARHWDTTEAEAVRRAVVEAARREKVL